MNNESVHILIITFNAEHWLPICCRQAADLPPGWKIVVVDNASQDGTVGILKKDYPHIQLIENEKNLGFGRANNLGLAKALEEGADYVFLLNQDASIDLGGIQRLMEIQKQHPECLILSPVHLNGTGDELDYAFGRLCTPENSPGLLLSALRGQTRDVYLVRKGIAAAWLLSREALLTVGGFNPLFFHYGEDEDYVNRVRFHGYEIGVAPGVFARHHRERRPKKKAVDSAFIDLLISMANPALPNPSKVRIIWSFLRPLRKALCRGDFTLAIFLARSCRDMLWMGAGASGQTISGQKGPSFLL